MENEKIKKALLLAINRIEENGWTQGAAHNEKGYCLYGALQCDNEYELKIRNEAFFLVCNKLGKDVSPVGWNDTPGRTKEEVLTLLRDTVKGLEIAQDESTSGN